MQDTDDRCILYVVKQVRKELMGGLGGKFLKNKSVSISIYKAQISKQSRFAVVS